MSGLRFQFETSSPSKDIINTSVLLMILLLLSYAYSRRLAKYTAYITNVIPLLTFSSTCSCNLTFVAVYHAKSCYNDK